MRRVFLLVASCFVMSLVFANAVTAQQQLTAEDFRGTGTGGYGCEADQYVASAPGDPGEGSLRCFDSAEAAAIYSNTGQLPQTSEPQQQPQQPTLGNSRAAAYDPANYDRSEINPNGPCFDPELSGDVTGVSVKDLPLAYVNRNDPVGTPVVSPLDSDSDGIACNALTQADARAIADGDDTADDQDANGQAPAEQYDDGAQEDNGMTELPNTGGPALLLPLGGLALAGLGTLFLSRRLS